MTTAHPSVLHNRTSGNPVPATAPANNPTRLHDGEAAADHTRPEDPASTENAP
ncbi:MAG: hypothetical protein ACE5F5_12385 [Acidimicrobiia bacterium]